MPTPIGHIASGVLLFASGPYHWRRQMMLLTALLIFALLPDIDLAIGLLLAGDANAWHHQATHSFLFVIVAGGLGGWMARRRGRYTLLFITAGVIHLLLDILAKDTSAPFGAPLFWPFWNGYLIAPLPLFSDVHRSGAAASFIPSLFNRHNLLTVMIELAFFAPLGLIACWRKRKAVMIHE